MADEATVPMTCKAAKLAYENSPEATKEAMKTTMDKLCSGADQETMRKSYSKRDLDFKLSRNKYD